MSSMSEIFSAVTATIDGLTIDKLADSLPHAQSVTITTATTSLPGQFWRPSSGTALSPALLLLHDAQGLDETTSQTAARLSQVGFAVLTPDLLAPYQAPESSDEKARLAWLEDLSDPHIVRNIIAAIDWLSQQDRVDAARLGVVGFGWGGAYALLSAAHDNRLRVAVNIAGTLTYPAFTAKHTGSPLNFVADIEGALLSIYPDSDPHFSRNEIERLRQKLIDHDKVGEVKIIADAPAYFWRDADSPACTRMWQRIISYLQEHLRGDSLDEDDGVVDVGDANEESRLHA
jgi:dienelactone hydrolase